MFETSTGHGWLGVAGLVLLLHPLFIINLSKNHGDPSIMFYQDIFIYSPLCVLNQQSCSFNKETFDLTVTRGTLWFDKYNNIGTFEPKRPSGNC